MKLNRLERSLWLPSPLEEVFAFFADARNLERLTPPWLGFTILNPTPVAMEEGVRIDYRIRLHGIPVRWQSRIAVWDPPHRFVDRQTRGPYRAWIHEHRFLADGDRTLVLDRVDYRVPGGELVRRFLVEPDLRRIFAYRHRRLVDHFGSATGPPAPAGFAFREGITDAS